MIVTPTLSQTGAPITVRVVKKDPQEKLRFIWALLAVLPDGSPRHGKVFEGQEFDYLGDPAGLENDPHLEVISDPDGRVAKAVEAREARLAAAREKQAKRRGAGKQTRGD